MSVLRVLLLAPYPLRSAPGQRYRFEQYLDHLAREGIEVDVRTLLDARTAGLLHQRGYIGRKAAFVVRAALKRLGDILRRAGHYDLVFIFRGAFPLGYPVFERMLSARGVPYMFDFDDAIYLPHVSPANRLVAPLKYAGKTAKIVEGASLVVAGNEHLARWAERYNERVRVIPSTIDTDVYRPRPRTEGSRVCVGWTGSTTTLAHLRQLDPVLRDLQRTHDIRIRVIGPEAYAIPGAEVESVRWREQAEVEDLRPIDIGVMPLPDDEWSRGKCGMKALQYMALEIPAVMSPVGVNASIAEGDAAMLASTEGEWREALTLLVEDPGRRRTLGERGRERVTEQYSVAANTPRYVRAIREAAEQGAG